MRSYSNYDDEDVDNSDNQFIRAWKTAKMDAVINMNRSIDNVIFNLHSGSERYYCTCIYTSNALYSRKAFFLLCFLTPQNYHRYAASHPPSLEGITCLVYYMQWANN